MMKGSTGRSNRQQKAILGHSVDRLPRDKRLEKSVHAAGGTAICTSCSSIHEEKYWFVDPQRLEELSRDGEVEQTLCPGCDRVKRHMHDGEVTLKSPFLTRDREAALALIKHTEEKAWHDNPLSRIASIREDREEIKIMTTTTWLAQRLGKAFHKAYSGDLEIKPSRREQFVRVYWSRAI